MTISVTLIDANNNTKTIRVEAGTKFEDILGMDEVAELTDYEAEDSVIEINGTDISDGGRLAEILMAAEAQEGDTIEFDCEFDMDEEDVAEELGVDQSAPASADAPTVSGTVGHVVVQISGGIIEVKLAITPGVTTVADALANNAVRVRSGYTDAQMAESTVQYRGQFLDTAEARRATKLVDGTVISVNARQASNKG